SMRAAISTEILDPVTLLEQVQAAPHMAGSNYLADVTVPETYVVPPVGEKRFTVVAVDLGIKGMTPKLLARQGIEVHVVPANTSIEDVFALNPDGLFMSNG